MQHSPFFPINSKCPQIPRTSRLLVQHTSDWPSPAEVRGAMGNHTTVTEFVLLGLSDACELQMLIFLGLLLTCLFTLLGNLFVVLILRDRHLHTPMYYFLRNFAILEIWFTLVIFPKMLSNILTRYRTIFLTGCFLQFFLYFFLGTTEFYRLAVMSFDRYVAICKPLRYVTINEQKGLCPASSLLMDDRIPYPSSFQVSSYFSSHSVAPISLIISSVTTFHSWNSYVWTQVWLSFWVLFWPTSAYWALCPWRPPAMATSFTSSCKTPQPRRGRKPSQSASPTSLLSLSSMAVASSCMSSQARVARARTGTMWWPCSIPWWPRCSTPSSTPWGTNRWSRCLGSRWTSSSYKDVPDLRGGEEVTSLPEPLQMQLLSWSPWTIPS